MAVAALEQELAWSAERIDDLDARLTSAAEDAEVMAGRLDETSSEAAALRARADELASLESRRRTELGAALGREQALALEHLRRAASPVGRFAGRWTQLADRVRLVRTADRVADAAVQAAILRPRILRPHPLFDAAWYVDQYDDVVASGADPYRHYRRHGSREGRRPNPYLDPDWYRARHADVTASGVDPIDHYHEHGWREGRDPSPEFDTAWYLRAYPDVLVTGIDPLEHYLSHGRSEGRSPRSPDGARWSLGQGRVETDAGRLIAPAGTAAPSRSGGSRVDRAEPARSADRWAVDIAAALAALPAGAVALVTADRDGLPPAAAGRHARWLAPVSTGGRLPVSDQNAIVRLEVARWAGADHLVVHRDQSWWLERCPELATHLDRYRRVPMGGAPVTVWRLTPVSRPVEDGTAALLARLRPATGRDLDTLAWGVPSGVVASRLGGTVFEPLADTGPLPYLDGTVDIVVIPEAAEERLEEARRVAGRAVLRIVGRRQELEAAWLAPDLASPPRTAVALLGGRAGFADETLVARVADSLLDAAVEELLVAVAPGMRLRTPSGPGLPRVRLLPIDPAASLVERARAAAEATAADLVALLDGTALPVPGWLGPLTAVLGVGVGRWCRAARRDRGGHCRGDRWARRRRCPCARRPFDRPHPTVPGHPAARGPAPARRRRPRPPPSRSRPTSSSRSDLRPCSSRPRSSCAPTRGRTWRDRADRPRHRLPRTRPRSRQRRPAPVPPDAGARRGWLGGPLPGRGRRRVGARPGAAAAPWHQRRRRVPPVDRRPADRGASAARPHRLLAQRLALPAGHPAVGPRLPRRRRLGRPPSAARDASRAAADA